MIQHDYTVNFNIDNLPGIYNKYLWEDDEIEQDIGFPLGMYLEGEDYFINNHVNIQINYTESQ